MQRIQRGEQVVRLHGKGTLVRNYFRYQLKQLQRVLSQQGFQQTLAVLKQYNIFVEMQLLMKRAILVMSSDLESIDAKREIDTSLYGGALFSF